MQRGAFEEFDLEAGAEDYHFRGFQIGIMGWLVIAGLMSLSCLFVFADVVILCDVVVISSWNTHLH